MKNKVHDTTKQLCTGALLLACGILLPQVFHMIGGPAAGGMFLPMHIPVILAGLLLGVPYGAILGVVIPLLSFMITGMPQAVKLPFMLLELTAYGIVSGIMRIKKPYGVYLTLICAQISGRLVYAIALLVATNLFALSVPPIVTVLTALVSGFPGLLIQWLFLPVLVFVLKRGLGFEQTV